MKARTEVDRPKERFLALLDEPPGAIHEPGEIARAVLRRPDEVANWLKEAASSGKAVAHPAGKGWIGQARLDALCARAEETLGAWHDAHKLEIGLSGPDLRAGLNVPAPLGDWVLDTLLAQGKAKEMTGGLLALAGRGASLSRDEEAALAEIERAFQEGKFSPPRPSEVLARHGAKGKTYYDLLLQRGALIEVAPDLAFHKDAAARAEAALREAAAKEGEVESARFRDILGTTRKFVIPLLEWFDKQGITKRVGNARFIRRYGK